MAVVYWVHRTSRDQDCQWPATCQHRILHLDRELVHRPTRRRRLLHRQLHLLRKRLGGPYRLPELAKSTRPVSSQGGVARLCGAVRGLVGAGCAYRNRAGGYDRAGRSREAWAAKDGGLDVPLLANIPTRVVDDEAVAVDADLAMVPAYQQGQAVQVWVVQEYNTAAHATGSGRAAADKH